MTVEQLIARLQGHHPHTQVKVWWNNYEKPPSPLDTSEIAAVEYTYKQDLIIISTTKPKISKAKTQN